MKRFARTLLVGGIYMLALAQVSAFTLTYIAGDHGKITGKTPQTVEAGQSGTAVKAVAASGYMFVGWSDGVMTHERTDTNVNADLTVEAMFDYATITKLMVLKGTCSETVHYVYDDPDPVASAIQRATYGVDAFALKLKPKVYFFLVVEVTYTPEFTDAGKWTSEGTLAALDFWTLGAVQYGIGMHDANGVYDKALKFAYDIGGSDPFWIGNSYWLWPKKKMRLADASVLCVDDGDTFSDSREGVAELVFAPKLIKDRATGDSWYEPNISSITISYAQLMQQLVGAPAAWKYVQMGVGKMKFKMDTKMTATANLTDPDTGENIGLAQVANEIEAVLVKGGYPDVLPNLDPFGYYAPAP